MIVIGVDAHRQTHTAAAATPDGRAAGSLEVRAREAAISSCSTWARGARRRAAVGDRGLPQSLRRLGAVLLAAGERVLRVPPKLMASQRKAARSFGKSDAIDALAVARAAIREPDLPEARAGRPGARVRGCCQTTATISCRRARAISGGCAGICTTSTPTSRRRCAALPNAQPGAPRRQLARREQTAQVRICRELVRRIRELAKRVIELDRELAALVRRPRPRPARAARLRRRSPPPGSSPRSPTSTRFSTDAQLASYAGVAPLDASSGRQQRHRLNRTGNRQLNRALYTIALTQVRIHPPAREYMARRIAEGKTRREAMRALKRHLIRTIYRVLGGSRRSPRPPGQGHPHPHDLT